MTVAIRPEAAQDRAAIWRVNQEAFGGDAEANLVEALRDGGFSEVSLVAEVDREIIGHILSLQSVAIEALLEPRDRTHQE